ncbi:MAG: hypothetical protein NTY76_04120 [Candidatus Omnitrophica bacterium]|nr:hypothetical protein [Candidatus Omnitrophota bacterium]
MHITLKEAIVISIFIHSAIFLPLSGKNIPPTHVVHKKDSIIVDYIKYKEPEAKIPETPKIEVTPKVEMKQSINAPADKAPAKTEKNNTDALAAKQAKIMSTKDYVNYYQLIREKIRRKLKERYRGYYNEGDVCLVFVLRSDGVLISAAASPEISTRDRTLIDTAIQSLKEAAPFTPFPKALTLPQMSFTLTVSFKKSVKL